MIMHISPAALIPTSSAQLINSSAETSLWINPHHAKQPNELSIIIIF